MVFFFPPPKPPSPQISVAKVLIVCYCHDKRLRNFLVSGTTVLHNICRCSHFRLFIQNGRLFSISQKCSSSNRNFKNKILEHSDPPSQHFFVHKAFSHSFLCRRKVVLCHLAEWHISRDRYNVVFKKFGAIFLSPPTSHQFYDVRRVL